MASLRAKIRRALSSQPQRLGQHARGYLLFVITRRLRPWLLRRPRYEFGANVRLQRLSSLLADGPGARIAIGADSILYEKARLEAHGNGLIEVGAGSILGDIRVYARARVSFGAGCLTSWNVLVQDYDSHPVAGALRAAQVKRMVSHFHPDWSREKRKVPDSAWAPDAAPIEIGANVWIGANAIILKGTRIGDGCVVAAGAVVAGGTFPPYTLVAGNPARALKELPR